jgi:hypothetical protein
LTFITSYANIWLSSHKTKKEVPMSNPNNLSAPKYEKLTISTVGEITHWLEEEAVGATAMPAIYLEKLRSFITFANDNDQRVLADTALMLAGVIGRTSEDRLADAARLNGGILHTEIDGITPLHEVTEDDIVTSAAQFDLTNPDYKGYNDSIEVSLVHSYIMEPVNAEMNFAGDSE